MAHLPGKAVRARIRTKHARLADGRHGMNGRLSNTACHMGKEEWKSSWLRVGALEDDLGSGKPARGNTNGRSDGPEGPLHVLGLIHLVPTSIHLSGKAVSGSTIVSYCFLIFTYEVILRDDRYLHPYR